MGKLGYISGKEAVKAFQKVGWQSVGTLRALIRHSGLTVDEFLNLL